MTLFKTSALSALAVLVKVGTSLFLSKVLAVYVGPAGFGVVGQFQSLVSTVTTFASGATANGVIKLTAESAAFSERQRAIWATAGTLGLAGAAIFAMPLVGMRTHLSNWVFGSAEHSDLFVWLAAALGFIVSNGLMLAVMNGRKAVKELAASNILGSLVTAIVATILATQWGLRGALLAIAIGPAVACGFTALMFRGAAGVHWRALVGKIDLPMARALGGFALMAATTAVVGPLGQIVIRDQLAAHLGWDTAGLWQALLRISETHLLLLTSTLSVYFLPRFAEIQVGAELQHEVRRGYLFIFPIVLATGTMLYAGREILVQILLTENFMPLTSALGLQLIGDALKICSWVVAFTMISHSRVRSFISTEIVFTGIFVLTTVTLSRKYGLHGAAMAYAGTYLAYWATVHLLYRQLVRELNRGAGLNAAALAP